MRAMVLEQFGGRLQLTDLPVPVPGRGEALVRVRACGVCQTDWKIIKGGHASSPRVRFPHTLGHEVAGVVESMGDGAPGPVAPGDSVVVNIYDICGECEYCRSGRESLCENLGAWIGFDAPGGMAEYVKVPAKNLVKLPPGLPAEQVAILGDAIGTSLRAVKTRGEVKAGETVLISGIGGVGIHAIQMAHHLGARVIAADVVPEKLQLARENGADYGLDARDDLAVAVQAVTGGRGADVALDFTGLPQALQSVAVALKKGGRLVMVGYQVDTHLSLPTQAIVIGELEVRGSRYCNQQELTEALDLVACGVVRPIIGAVLPLEQANEGLELIRSGRVMGRVVLSLSEKTGVIGLL